MIVLNEQQIRFILDDIQKNGVESDELQLDLLDHVCCVLEQEMKPDDQFEVFYKEVLKRFFKHNLKEIQKETDLLLMFKNYYAMKKVMITSGAMTVFTFFTGGLFKIMHWPGASALLLLSIFLLSFVFLPILFVLKSREMKAIKDKIILGIATTFGILISLATLFKIMHWPGANIMWLISLGILLLLFLPLYFFGGIRNPETKLNTIVSSVLIFVAGMLLFTLTQLRNNRMVDETVYRSNDLALATADLAMNYQNADTANEQTALHANCSDLLTDLRELKQGLISGSPELSEYKTESDAIRYYGNNFEIPDRYLFDSSGKPKSAIKDLKKKIKKVQTLILEKTGENYAVFNVEDKHRFDEPDSEMISWEETYFLHAQLATVIRNLNNLTTAIMIIDKNKN